MNPSGTEHHHDPSREELLELGMLAIEDANLSEARVSAPQTQPVPLPVHQAPAPVPDAPRTPEPVPPPPTTVISPEAPPEHTAGHPAEARQPAPLPPIVPPAHPASAAPQTPAAGTPPQPIDPSEVMEYSANTTQLKSVARLRAVTVVLYMAIIGLAAVIILAGWFLYTKLGTGA